jgi:tRNA-dihydrouridine synthase B
MQIGKYNIKNPVSLAPMADITDIAFRILCKKYDCGLTVTEMVNAHAVIHDEGYTKKMYTCDSFFESPRIIQVFGSNKDAIVEASKILEKECDILNFNMGCPAEKVVGINAGSALLKDLKSAKEILKSLKDEIKIPVTVKTRIGYDDNINILDFAKVCNDIGIDALMIHGRTKAQGYFGNADWTSIEQAKKTFIGPVIGNGDVIDEVSCKKMLEICDGAMIGRAAIGNPFLFKRINFFLETGNFMPKESANEKLNHYFEYVKLADKYQISSFERLKRQAMWFTRGLLNSKELRDKISKSSCYDEINEYLHDYLNKIA